MENPEVTQEGFGWFYYKKGRGFGVTKNHYLPKGKWQTLCGNHTVNPVDGPRLRFTDTSQLFKHKLCKSCLYLCNTKSWITC
jgi:hypothetical protein